MCASLCLAQIAAAEAIDRAGTSLEDEVVVELRAWLALIVDELERQLRALVRPHVVIATGRSGAHQLVVAIERIVRRLRLIEHEHVADLRIVEQEAAKQIAWRAA